MPETIISQFQRAYNSPIETRRQVNTSTDRDNIPSSVRWRGMLVHVISDDVTYELVGGIDNGSWQPLGGLQDAPSDGEYYVRWNGGWAIMPSPSLSLSDLSDVSSATPTDKNVLVANGTDWESRALTEGDISDFGSYLSQGANVLTSDFSALNSLGNGFVSDNDTGTTEIRGGQTGVNRVRAYFGGDLWGVDFESNGLGIDYSLHKSGTPTDTTDLIPKGYADLNYAPFPTYTEVFALISQSGTNNPTAEILLDTTTGLTLTRQGVGLYRITPGDYVQSDTYISATITSEGTAQDLRLKISKQASYIQFATYSGGALADNVINQMSLHIKVFS